jgi:cytochrome c biogenesis protein CcmG, thiol:disulfide interchange protein DsbE
MTGWPRFLPIVLLAVIVGAMVWRLANPPDSTVQSALVGKSVPQFQAPAALPGKPPLTSADLADGRPKLVNIFASWCLPCIAEAPLLEQLREQGIPLVGIAVRDRPEDLARFLDRHGDPFDRIAPDPQSTIQLAFGSSGVPETFVVDGDGIIRMQHIGAIEPHHVPMLARAVEAAR